MDVLFDLHVIFMRRAKKKIQENDSRNNPAQKQQHEKNKQASWTDFPCIFCGLSIQRYCICIDGMFSLFASNNQDIRILFPLYWMPGLFYYG